MRFKSVGTRFHLVALEWILGNVMVPIQVVIVFLVEIICKGAITGASKITRHSTIACDSIAILIQDPTLGRNTILITAANSNTTQDITEADWGLGEVTDFGGLG